MSNVWEEMTPAMAEGFAAESHTPTHVIDTLAWAGVAANENLEDGWEELELSNEPGYHESLRPWEF